MLPFSYRHPLTGAIERGKPAYTVRGPHPHELTLLPFLHLDILHQHLKIKRANKSVHSSCPLCMETLGQEPLKMGELLLVQRPHLWKIQGKCLFALIWSSILISGGGKIHPLVVLDARSDLLWELQQNKEYSYSVCLFSLSWVSCM